MNVYAYVGGNTANATDPTGTSFLETAGDGSVWFVPESRWLGRDMAPVFVGLTDGSGVVTTRFAKPGSRRPIRVAYDELERYATSWDRWDPGENVSTGAELAWVMPYLALPEEEETGTAIEGSDRSYLHLHRATRPASFNAREREARAAFGDFLQDAAMNVATAPLAFLGVADDGVRAVGTANRGSRVRAAVRVGDDLAQQIERSGDEIASGSNTATHVCKEVASVAESVDLRPYRGPGGGHHVPAKGAFVGAPGYDLKEALAIPNETMTKLKLNHPTITGAQASGYMRFAKTGQKLTWDVIEDVETKALTKGGLGSEEARATARKGIEFLKACGVAGPTRIPWGD